MTKQQQADWLFNATSLYLDRVARYHAKPEEIAGLNLLRFLLDNVLSDSCTGQNRIDLMEGLKEKFTVLDRGASKA